MVQALEALTIALILFAAGVSIFEGDYGASGAVAHAIELAFILAVTRRKSALARWIYTGLILLASGLVAVAIWRDGAPHPSELHWADWVLIPATIAQLILLWSRPMSVWIATRAKRDRGPGAFRAIGIVALLVVFFYAVSASLGLWGS